MLKTIGTIAAGLMMASLSGAATAGERTGTGAPTPLKGASICQFSGLNDDPNAEEPFPNGPPGRTQSYGQDVAKWGADPRNNKIVHPGNLCNPNVLPMKTIGKVDF